MDKIKLVSTKKDNSEKYQISKSENTSETWSDYKSITNLYKAKVENKNLKIFNE